MNNPFENITIIDYIKTLEQKNIPSVDYRKHIGIYLEFKAREKAIPLTGSLELTPFCNLDCKMCYVHLTKKQFGTRSLLPEEVWKDLIRQAYDCGMRKTSLTGGECLLYPGFEDIYMYLYELGIEPSILSNGILIDEKRLAFFKRYPPKRIQISLYGSSDDAYERVTGHRVFNEVYSNIIRLRETNIPLKIAITPNKYMKDDIELLLKKAEELEVPYFINSSLIVPRENTGRNKLDLSLDDYIKIYRRTYSRKSSVKNTSDLTELQESSHTDSKRYGLKCGGGKSSFAIRYDGILCPCTSLTDIAADPKALGFKKAWEQINNRALNYPLPVECGDCGYLDVCPVCVVLHKDAPQKGHCNTLICERTQRLVKEGFLPSPFD